MTVKVNELPDGDFADFGKYLLKQSGGGGIFLQPEDHNELGKLTPSLPANSPHFSFASSKIISPFGPDFWGEGGWQKNMNSSFVSFGFERSPGLASATPTTPGNTTNFASRLFEHHRDLFLTPQLNVRSFHEQQNNKIGE